MCLSILCVYICSQFYKAQLASYSSIRDDYMRKYAQFPLAIELEKRKLELAAAQTRLEELEAVKQDLKHKIFYKESEFTGLFVITCTFSSCCQASGLHSAVF